MEENTEELFPEGVKCNILFSKISYLGELHDLVWKK